MPCVAGSNQVGQPAALQILWNRKAVAHAAIMARVQRSEVLSKTHLGP
jgi:hypothetical protein